MSRHRRRQNTHKAFSEAAATTVPAAGAARSQQPKQQKQQERPLRVGERLRMERERTSLELHDIAEHLRIRPEFLHALEQGQYNDLPAQAYIVGFLRSYAQYLGLDSAAVLAEYRREAAGKPHAPLLSMPQPLPEGQTPHVLIIIGGLILAVAIYAGWYFSVARDRAVITPAVPGLSKSEAAPAMTLLPGSRLAPAPPPQTAAASAAPPPAASAVTAPAGHAYGATDRAARLVVKAERESWVTISDAQGNVVFSHMLEPGDTYLVPDGAALDLTTGNAGSITLSLDGKDLPKLGGQGQVMRNVRLDPAALKKQ